MSVTATQIFEFLHNQSVWEIDRQEIAFQPFGRLRRNLWKIIFRLTECDDDQSSNVLDELRPLISEWLTVPVPFDNTILESLTSVVGAPRVVEERWGLDIRQSYEEVIEAAKELTSMENPMRTTLRATIDELHRSGRSYKVFCHPRAGQHFASLFSDSSPSPLAHSSFLHSVRDYQEVSPFEFLLKVGPLRSRGWGFAPDALITAPRFATLKQIVWSGSKDQSDFGYDPVSRARTNVQEHATATPFSFALTDWQIRETLLGEGRDAGASEAERIDELQCLQEIFQRHAKRAATLIQIDRDQAILYPPNSRILSLDQKLTNLKQIDHRVPGHGLTEGMFLIRPVLHELDLGEGKIDATSSTALWKRRLQGQLQKDGTGLIRNLRKAGINLVHLDSATQRWCEFSNGVIHAPQYYNHFAMLIEVLGLADGQIEVSGGGSVPFAQHAWREIRRSRGEAIQAGFVEKEIVEEQLFEILNQLLPTIRTKAATEHTFRLLIPPSSEVQGSLVFHLITGIEEGFHVPEGELRILHELKTTDKWRD